MVLASNDPIGSNDSYEMENPYMVNVGVIIDNCVSYDYDSDHTMLVKKLSIACCSLCHGSCCQLS